MKKLEEILASLPDETAGKIRDAFYELQEESMRTIIGGVAHNYNNLLQVIIGNLGLLAEGDSLSEEGKGSIEAMQQSSERMARIAEDLLHCVGSIHQRKDVTLDLTQETVKASQSLLAELGSVRVTYELKNGIFIKADPTYISKALRNIIKNNLEAINPDGTVSIQTYADKDNAIVNISNDGGQIPDDVMHRLTLPFYTTKGMASAIGLGLSAARGIIKFYHGSLAIDSTLEGTRTIVQLPSCPPPKKILICEEDNMANLLGRMVQKGGYQILNQHSPSHALMSYRANRDNISCVMIGINDPADMQLYQSIRSENNEVPILLLVDYLCDIEKIGNTLSVDRPVAPLTLLRSLEKLIPK